MTQPRVDFAEAEAAYTAAVEWEGDRRIRWETAVANRAAAELKVRNLPTVYAPGYQLLPTSVPQADADAVRNTQKTEQAAKEELDQAAMATVTARQQMAIATRQRRIQEAGL